jgi:hypothetical protein
MSRGRGPRVRCPPHRSQCWLRSSKRSSNALLIEDQERQNQRRQDEGLRGWWRLWWRLEDDPAVLGLDQAPHHGLVRRAVQQEAGRVALVPEQADMLTAGRVIAAFEAEGRVVRAHASGYHGGTCQQE